MTIDLRVLLAACAVGSLAACNAPPPQQSAQSTTASTAANSGVAQVSGTVAPAAVVSLMPAAGEPLPAASAVMDQISKRFEPGALYVRVGQPVEFKNSEDMPHNVTAVRRGPGSTVFNVGTEPQQKYVHTFDRAGQYDIVCDMHPGMEAVVIAAASSRATVSGDDGTFTFPGVPVGDYKLNVTFKGRTVEQPITVTAPMTKVTLKP